MHMPQRSNKIRGNARGNSTLYNNFQLPLINSHWKMLTFMPSFHQREQTRWFTEMHFTLHPTSACCSFICQECQGTKGPRPLGECWLNLALLLCAVPRSPCLSSPDGLQMPLEYQRVQWGQRAPQPITCKGFKQFP